jgi:hypothetical protein
VPETASTSSGPLTDWSARSVRSGTYTSKLTDQNSRDPVAGPLARIALPAASMRTSWANRRAASSVRALA